MKHLFVVTLGDVVGIVMTALILIAFGVFWCVMKFYEWRARRRHATQK